MTDPIRERHHRRQSGDGYFEPHYDVCIDCNDDWPCDAIRAADERDTARADRDDAWRRALAARDRYEKAEADAERLAAMVAESDDDGFCRWCRRMLYFFDESLDQQGGWHDDHSRHADDCPVPAALRAHDEATR